MSYHLPVVLISRHVYDLSKLREHANEEILTTTKTKTFPPQRLPRFA